MTQRAKHLRTFTILGLALMSQCASFAQTKPVLKKEPQTKQEQKQPTAQATAPVPAKAEAPKPLAPKFTLKMIEGEKLDQAFTGISLADLINAVEKSTNVEKGEFESTSDFNARKAAALSVRFLGDYGIDDTFAVVRSVASGGRYPRGLSYTFNPDTSEVAIYVLPKSNTLNGIGAPDYQSNRRESHGLDLFEFDTKMEYQSTYQGSNAYGATVTVEKSIMSGSGLAASQVPFLSFKREIGYSNPSSALQFKMDNSKAARELPALKALIVFKLAEPFMHYHFVHKEPKRGEPTDIAMQYKYISSSILGIVYYSGLTGEILARLPDSFGKPQILTTMSAAAPAPGPTAAAPTLAAPPAPKPQAVAARIDVSSCDKPEYPAAALRADAPGATKIRFTVDATGLVSKAEIERAAGASREHRLLDRAAVEALSKCRFKPGTDEQGKAVGGTTVVEYVWKTE